jgi:hypothetical protein
VGLGVKRIQPFDPAERSVSSPLDAGVIKPEPAGNQVVRACDVLNHGVTDRGAEVILLSDDTRSCMRPTHRSGMPPRAPGSPARASSCASSTVHCGTLREITKRARKPIPNMLNGGARNNQAVVDRQRRTFHASKYCMAAVKSVGFNCHRPVREKALRRTDVRQPVQSSGCGDAFCWCMEERLEHFQAGRNRREGLPARASCVIRRSPGKTGGGDAFLATWAGLFKGSA